MQELQEEEGKNENDFAKDAKIVETKGNTFLRE